jgi:hypothetical protein
MATSAHDPRLLAAQQPSCHEQVPSGNIEDQTLGTGQVGIVPTDILPKTNLIQRAPFATVLVREILGRRLSSLTSPDLLDVRVASA